MRYSQRAFTIICLIKGIWIIQKDRATLRSTGNEPASWGRKRRQGELIIYIRLSSINVFLWLIEEGSLHRWKPIKEFKRAGHRETRFLFWDPRLFDNTWPRWRVWHSDALPFDSVIKLTGSWTTEKTVRVNELFEWCSLCSLFIFHHRPGWDKHSYELGLKQMTRKARSWNIRWLCQLATAGKANWSLLLNVNNIYMNLLQLHISSTVGVCV